MRRRLLLTAAVLAGASIGIGAFTFVYARGYSYLTNDPQACANCHIMDDHFSSWLASSHRAVAVCNDCHTPHDFVGKWTTKARNGFWHSFYFTIGTFPYPIRITDRNREITGDACLYCHARLVAMMTPAHQDGETAQVRCSHCHRHVGHWIR